MKILSLLILIYLVPALIFGETVTIASSSITVENADTVDLTASEKWFIHIDDDVWKKSRYTLYPTKTDRTQAVIDAQTAAKTEIATYIKECIESGNCVAQGSGKGLTLTSQTSVVYPAVKIAKSGHIFIYITDNNKNHLLALYPDQTLETAAATTARVNLMTELAIIDVAADAGDFWK